MKDLKKLRGAKSLSKNEQKSIKGGILACRRTVPYCPPGYVCIGSGCYKSLEPL